VLMGGYDGSRRNDVWRSTDQGATWTQLTAAATWTGRERHSSLALPDGSLVLMGGWDDGSFRNDVWRSTDQGASWTQQTAAAEWTARFGHSSVALGDGSLVLIGGWDISSRRNDVWRSTDQGATWTLMTGRIPIPWTGRSGHSSVALGDGSIVLMGGADGSYRNDVWRLETAGSNEQHPVKVYSEPGTYSVTLQAYSDNGFSSMFREAYISVMEPEAPEITSVDNTTFMVGKEGSFTVTAIAMPIPKIDQDGNLPEGVTFTDNGDGTATLAGTPAVGSGGVYLIIFTASNGVQPDAVQTFTLTMEEEPSPSELKLELSVEPDPVILHQPANFTAVVTNEGYVTVEGVIASGVMPAFVIFVRASPECTFEDNILTCDLGALVPGQSKSAWVTLIFTSTGTFDVSMEAEAPGAVPSIDAVTFDVESRIYIPVIFRGQ
jgi:hypothetical protein